MSLGDFRQALAASPQLGLRFRLPTGGLSPIHLHLTEVARVEKRYIDCGGTIRTDISARLQLWAADDTDHRVGCAKALQVLDRGAGLVGATDVPLEVEHDFPFLTVFPVVGSVVEGGERIARGHTNGPIKVVLPEGYLDNRDDMTIPDDGDVMRLSGG